MTQSKSTKIHVVNGFGDLKPYNLTWSPTVRAPKQSRPVREVRATGAEVEASPETAAGTAWKGLRVESLLLALFGGIGLGFRV